MSDAFLLVCVAYMRAGCAVLAPVQACTHLVRQKSGTKLLASATQSWAWLKRRSE